MMSQWCVPAGLFRSGLTRSIERTQSETITLASLTQNIKCDVQISFDVI